MEIKFKSGEVVKSKKKKKSNSFVQKAPNKRQNMEVP